MNLYDLTPDEFMAYHYIKSKDFQGQAYSRTADLAVILKCTDRTARRVVASLISKGCIIRLSRSLYSVVRFEETPVPFADTSVLSRHSNIYTSLDMSSNTSNEVLQEAETRPESLGGIEVKYYDDDSQLGGVGMLEEKPAPAKKANKTSMLKYHRTVPRSEWNMHYVAKEFRQRLSELSRTSDRWRTPIIGTSTEEKRLVQALYKWQSDYGITPEEAATLLDEFFESGDIERVSNEFPPYKLYMQYIKVNIDKLRARAVTSDVLDEIGGQVLPW